MVRWIKTAVTIRFILKRSTMLQRFIRIQIRIIRMIVVTTSNYHHHQHHPTLLNHQRKRPYNTRCPIPPPRRYIVPPRRYRNYIGQRKRPFIKYKHYPLLEIIAKSVTHRPLPRHPNQNDCPFRVSHPLRLSFLVVIVGIITTMKQHHPLHYSMSFWMMKVRISSIRRNHPWENGRCWTCRPPSRIIQSIQHLPHRPYGWEVRHYYCNCISSAYHHTYPLSTINEVKCV